MNCALITGASSGIGEAIARELAKDQTKLILVARRKDRLAELKKEFEKEYKAHVETHVLDVINRKAVMKLAESDAFSDVNILINNAGLAKGVEKMYAANLDDWDAMIDTNVKGLLTFTRAILPEMIKQERGHIVNLGSVAGRWVYPGGAVYCASKFAVRAISEGLRMDLLGTPIRVTSIEPGMVETEFSEVRLGNAERAKSVYRGMTPLTAKDVAETVVWCLKRPAHVNVQELVLFPTDQAAIQHVHRRE